MDTNGLLITKEFVNKLDNITFCITLSEKTDHDSLRITEGNLGSYDIIVNDIRNIQSVLDDKHKMMIRYNVNHLNIKKIEEFLKEMQGYNISDIIVAIVHQRNRTKFKINNRFA